MLRLIGGSKMSVSLAEVDHLFSSAGDRPLLLLLTEATLPKAKPGIPALAVRVLGSLVDQHGPVDEALSAFVVDRPRVLYRRLSIDRNDSAVLARIGACWLPQVRLVRNGTVLFRSSVSISDTGDLLAQDVGGISFRRRLGQESLSSITPLLPALAAELDRLVVRRPVAV